MRADSFKSAGWADPWAFLAGAAETTGLALKRADVLGVGTVVGVSADITLRTGKLLVGGAKKSTRVVTDASNTLVIKPVGKVVVGTGRAVSTGVTTTGRAIGAGISHTGKAVGSAVSSTGRALSMIVPGTPRRGSIPKGTPHRRNSKATDSDTVPVQ